MRCKFSLLAAAAIAVSASPALAAPGDPIALSDSVSLKLLANARLRYELVDQVNQPDEAEALTFRLRAGTEIKAGDFSLLAEGEGTAEVTRRYNDTLPGNGIEPYPVVADPKNLELNRLQASYMHKGTGVTVGRQRIILDDARFVGNVGWRQNEQTFDAVRGQAKIGPVTLDATYSDSQRTVFGVHSPNEHFDGDLVLLNGGIKLPAAEAKAFAYLIDYDTRVASSSQTYGVLVTGGITIPAVGKLKVLASYARQSDYGANPVSYSADYINAQLGLGLFGFDLIGGYEQLGSDGGVAAFQTPLATLHAFNGWADMFLTTPAKGLRDYYATVGHKFAVPALPGLTANVTYHQFDSDVGGLDYGSEWDASLGSKLGPVGLLAKYANYQADGFAVDTEKFWLQAEVGF
uniref:alginate export family protein n=1 Tax=Altererythrobacter segetis TaxID=1104773 RepID=UPI00140AB684|nr:alginate export family protein [Altererythrobacter segetis]